MGVPNVSWSISPQSGEQFLALAIGFAVAGLISTGYQLLTERPASFRLLEQGDRKSTRLNSSHIPLSRMPASA